MKHFTAYGLALVLLTSGAPCLAQEHSHVMVSPEDVKWGEASPENVTVISGVFMLGMGERLGPYDIQYVNPADDPSRKSGGK